MRTLSLIEVLLVLKKKECKNMTLLLLFKEIKHFELKCRDMIRANASQCLVKKVKQRGGATTCLLSSFQKRIG